MVAGSPGARPLIRTATLILLSSSPDTGAGGLRPFNCLFWPTRRGVLGPAEEASDSEGPVREEETEDAIDRDDCPF